jgi:hypothetical protein
VRALTRGVMRLTMRRGRLSSVLVLALCACSEDRVSKGNSVAPAEDGELVEVEGCYSCCFESNFFIADRNRAGVSKFSSPSEVWNVASKPADFSSQFYALSRGKLRGPGDFDVAVKIRGKLGPVGSYGHMGVASRQLSITQFWDMKPLTKYPSCLPGPEVEVQ